MKKILITIYVALPTLFIWGQSPGGVTPTVWYKSDVITSSDNTPLNQWIDQMGTGRNLLQATASLQPTFSNQNTLANFNPTVTFNSAGHGTAQGGFMASDPGTGNEIIDRSKGSIYIAGKMNTLGAAGLAGFDQSMDYPGLHISNNATTDKLLFYTAGSGYTTLSTNLFADKKPFVAGSSWQNAAGSTTSYSLAKVWLDGNESIYNNTLINVNTGNTARIFRIGRDTNWGSHDGQMNEVMVFAAPLTDAEKKRVDSYLAVKWGTTLTGDYVNSAGSIVWNASPGYQNNIMGIARDNLSALYQKQSRSENPGQKLIIGIGNSLANTNMANTNTLQDGQFLLVGDNGLEQRLKTPLSYTAGSNGEINSRFGAVWRVQNTSNVGTVTIAWPKGVENLYLVQSPDAVFDAGDTYIPMITEVTVNGVVYNTASVTLTNGQYFTFAGYLHAPGGVSNNLSYWYRADKNTVNTGNDTDVTEWTDQISGVTSAKISTAPLPKYKMGASDYFNFNPGVNFTAIQQIIGNISNRTLESVNYDIFTFTKEGMTGTRFFNIGFNNTSFGGANWDQPGFYADGSIGSRNNAGGSIVYNLNPGNVAFNADIPNIMYHTFTDTTLSKGLNGSANGTTFTHGTIGLVNGGHLFGANGGVNPPGGDDWGFTGHIGETIIYGAGNLTAVERRRVDSYLAIKYGVTLGRVNTDHYLASDAGIVWNGTNNTGYNNNIFGIANDKLSALIQKQSKSVNTGQKLIIGAGNSLAETNDANPNTLSAGQFLIVGDNNLKQELSIPLSYTSGSNGAINYRFESIWKAQNTGNVGVVTVAWPKGVGNLYLVQSADAAFDGTDTFTPMTAEVTINGMVYNTVNITLGNGQYFTLAGYIYAPGGVSSAAWYRADAANTLFSDAGTTVAADNATVQQWNEFNSKPFPLSQSTTAYRPLLSSTAELVNFNPTVNYDGTQKWLQYAPADAQGYILDRSKGALFSAGNTTSAASSLFGFGVAGSGNAMDDPGLYSFTGNKFLFYPVIGEYDPQSTYTINGSYIGGGTWENGAGTGGNNAVNITLNGFHQTYNTGISNVNTAAARNALMVGKADAGAQLVGQQNEMIVFSNKLTDEEVNKVESYLAIKYGKTLSKEQNRNYLSSTGTIVWDGSAGNSYYNNVFGIARDQVSALYQKQSRSDNANQKLIIGAGTSLANTNAANTNILTEGQFLLTGDNGLEQKLKTPLSYTAGTNGAVNNRFESIWKVQNISNVGTVTVAWPKGVKNLYLVQSSDAVFDGTDTFTPMLTEVTVNGVVYNTANVTLGNGQYFTLAGFAQAPGGVTGPDFWVKSNDSGTISTAWKDNSANADDIPNVGGITLSPADRSHNFYPYTTGYTSSKLFYNPASVLNPLGNVELPNTNTSIFSAVRPTGANGTGRITGIDDDVTYASEPGVSIANGKPRQYEYFNTITSTDFSTIFNTGISSIFSTTANNSVANGGTSSFSGGEKRLGLNGIYETTSFNNANKFQIYGRNLRIGHAGWDAAGAFPGDIMEVIWYKRTLTANEQSRVNSYLAVKNGVTSNENYLSANNNVVWDRTVNTGYNNNIFGIAKDDFTALDQRQSGSINALQKMVISTTGLADSNAANSTGIANDLQYLLTGDNGLEQKLKIPLPSPYTTGTNGEANHRFESIWKVQNTGNVGTVTVAWPKGVRNLYLVQSPDAAFDGSDTFTPMAAETTVNGMVYNTANIALGNGQYFTLAGYLGNYCTTGCNENTFLNASDPNTIEYDNLVATDNAVIAKEKDGTFKIWGYTTGPTSIPSNANVLIDLLTPTAITPANGFNYTGTPLKATVAGITSPGALLLTTDGLYGWGTRNVPYTKTTNNTTPAFGKIIIDGKADGLPPGVAPTDVKMLFQAYMSLVIVTCKGEAWTMNGYSSTGSLFGDGMPGSTANNAIWHRVKTSASETLDNVVAVRGSGGAQFALTSEGKLYTWGLKAYIGDGSDHPLTGTDRPFATEVTVPAGVTPKMIGMTEDAGASAHAYFLLATNGQLFAMGHNGDGILGDGTNTSRSTWQEVTATSNGHTLGGNIVWISPSEHGRDTAPTMNVLTRDKKQWGWGSNDGYKLGQASPTGTYYNPIYMPGNTTNADGLGLNDEITAVETGGRFTINYKKSSPYFGFVGASAYGTIGNGTTGNGSYQKYTYNTGLVDICSTTLSGVCYKPGMLTGIPLETKAGITALGRAGVNADNWPMVRKGGWLALEAKTKGFVPNRVAFDASGNPAGIPAANFVEGMMVYDTTNKCMKIYTQKEGDASMAWHCISTQTCPD